MFTLEKILDSLPFEDLLRDGSEAIRLGPWTACVLEYVFIYAARRISELMCGAGNMLVNKCDDNPYGDIANQKTVLYLED
ncbi:MAG TPA: hypothetical protein VMU18_10130 [Rhodoblastus sp.]|nr:hypothetical protein [Rhodoblastus sp.]